MLQTQIKFNKKKQLHTSDLCMETTGGGCISEIFSKRGRLLSLFLLFCNIIIYIYIYIYIKNIVCDPKYYFGCY